MFALPGYLGNRTPNRMPPCVYRFATRTLFLYGSELGIRTLVPPFGDALLSREAQLARLCQLTIKYIQTHSRRKGAFHRAG